MLKRILALSIIITLAACGQKQEDTAVNPEKSSSSVANQGPFTDSQIEAESIRLNTWFDEKFEAETLKSPILLSYLGRSERQDEWDDFSDESTNEYVARSIANVTELKANFNYEKLSDVAKISYDFWVYLAEQITAEDKFRNNGYIFEQMNAVHSLFPQVLISMQRVEDAEGMENYIKRISATETAMDQLIAASKKNAETGVRPPYFSFESVINESTKIISGAPFDSADDSALWADAQAKIASLLEENKIDQAQADTLVAKTKTALLENFKPAYEKLIAWQKEDKKNTKLAAQGVSELPNGDAFYNERLANQTTTTLTANEIHEIGLKEVARLRGEMETAKEAFGFEGTLAEYFVFLRETKDDERLYYPNTDAGRQGYIDDATAAINKIKAVLPEYFGILPKADMIVKRVEAFREQDGAAQHYMSSTPDGSRPGVYYAHLSDMTAMPKRELEVIAYHEGLPGHHMQGAVSLELTGLPIFRTQSYLNAYGEGWALYTEWLAKEMPGTYQDPLSEFGRLGSEIWRAIRLVVDTGLHAKGWSEAEAISYFKANSAITKEQAQSEVRRYLVLPGQATGYKIGMLKIQELRARAESKLGDKFDIRDFHDVILGGGALPLTILERKVDNWIADTKV